MWPRSPSLTVLLLALLLPGLFAHPSPQALAQAGTTTLRILHTNDHHGHLEPLVLEGVIRGGVARRATLVSQLRAESEQRGEPLLLLDAGDVFQGTPFFEHYEGQADLIFYNAMAYDAMAVGNHEFDRGDQPLAAFAAGAHFPLLSANMRVTAPSPLVGKVRPWTIIERGGLRIGVFGLTTPHTSWLSAPGAGVTFDDPTAAAVKAVRELEAQRVAVIIALAHLGATDELALLRHVSGIDVMVGGHSHTRLTGNGRTYPIAVTRADGSKAVYATAWEFGMVLGDLAVQLDAAGRVVGAEGREIEVGEQIAPDPRIDAQIAELRARMRR